MDGQDTNQEKCLNYGERCHDKNAGQRWPCALKLLFVWLFCFFFSNWKKKEEKKKEISNRLKDCFVLRFDVYTEKNACYMTSVSPTSDTSEKWAVLQNIYFLHN